MPVGWPALLGFGERGCEEDGLLRIRDQGHRTFFGPAEHALGDVGRGRVEKEPLAVEVDYDVAALEQVDVREALIEEQRVTPGQPRDAYVESRARGQGCKQGVDITESTTAFLQCV